MRLKQYIDQSFPEPLSPALKKIHGKSAEIFGWREKQSNIDRKLIDEFFNSKEEYESYQAEIMEPPVDEWIEKGEDAIRDRLSEGLGNYDTCARYYCLARKLSPSFILETGVRHGQSTLFLLAAIKMNGSGKLTSIDYPLREDEVTEELIHRNPNCVIPANEDPGWIIPEVLDENWNLIQGPSQHRLVNLLSDSGNIDMFIHDSEHSLNCMLFEYEATWPRLSSDGILISDDIRKNDAWDTFLDSKSIRRSGMITNNVAYARKGRE